MKAKLSIKMETRAANVTGDLECWFHDDATRKAVTMALAKAGFRVVGTATDEESGSSTYFAPEPAR